MKSHLISFFLGFVLDLIIGDPYILPHPIRGIGRLISFLDTKLRLKDTTEKMKNKNLRRGFFLVLLVLLNTLLVSAAILSIAYILHPALGIVVESIMCYQILATKCLKVESNKVYIALKERDILRARKAVSMIVGRDTECLNEIGVAKASIETVAENTSDGVIAPMLYLALGGPVLGFFYKAVNTMDSMIGYKNEKYLYFGRAAAKLDDVCNYLPARISAFLMIAATFILNRFDPGSFDPQNARYIYNRDKRKHSSPNSAHTEAVCAGALNIQLAGNASYFGKMVKKPFIGDANRIVKIEDIVLANRLLYTTAILCEGICGITIYILCCTL